MANDVTIRVNYRDLDNAFESARELHELLRTMGRANYRINFDYHQLQDALNLLQQANTQLQNLVNQTGQQGQNNFLTQTAYNIENITRDIRDENAAWRQLEEQRRQQHEAEMQRQRQQEERLRTQLDLINAIGSAIQGIGSISSATADFANGIGKAFSSMSDVFSSDLLSYAAKTIVRDFTRDLIGNISSVTSRYDILRTFVPYMNLVGVDAETATSAQRRINESILGLPIGLDEATQRLRRYYMYTGDLSAATNLTIGVQNAITAGGAGESYKTQAYNMIERMLATGTLTNIRQWQSLMVGLGVSQKYIEMELGLPAGTLLQNIREKTISVDEFLAALQRLGTGATDAAKGLNSALDIYKTTLESWVSNIEFAVIRGNERVLGALNDTLELVSGQGITGYMRNYRDFLNDTFKGVANYITNNPGRLDQFLKDITILLDAIRQFSATAAVNNILQYFTIFVEAISSLLGQIPPGELEQFAAFATTLAGPLGKLFSAVSSGAPAMIAVFERFKEFDFQTLVDWVVKHASTMERLIESLLNLFGDETISWLIGFGLVWGKPVAAAFNAIGSAIITIGTFALHDGFARIGRVFNLLTQFGNTAAGAALGYTTLAGAIITLAGAIVFFDEKSKNSKWNEQLGTDDITKNSNTINAVARTGSPESVNANWNLALSNRRDAAAALSAAQEEYDAAYAELQGSNGRNSAINRRYSDASRKLAIAKQNYGTASNAYLALAQAKHNNNEEIYGGPTEWSSSSIDSVSDSLNVLADAYDEVAEAAEYSIGLQIDLWGNAGETIPEIIERLQGDAATASQFMTATYELLQYVTPENATLIQDLISGGVDSLDRMKEVLEELPDDAEGAKKALNELAAQNKETEATTKAASAMFADFMDNLEEYANEGYTYGYMIGQMLRNGIDAGAEEAARAAWRMAYRIRMALSDIPAYITQGLSGNAAEFEWLERAFSTGGLVYAANGMFIPRGTDTVPAMLTPGEFVMRKQAVDTFGAAFMKSINDLNIGAAFDRLINTKLSNPRGFVNNTYNNRDDHSTHNQYIKTNNPAFAAKRAGRFVRAMA